MKYLISLILCAFIGLFAFGQSSRKIDKAFEEIYTSTDSLVGDINPQIPEEYSNASVVCIADVSVQQIKNIDQKKTHTSIFRVVLKLRDAAALEQYSTFSFNNTKRGAGAYKQLSIFAMRVHKNSGEIVNIDLADLEKNGDDEIAIPNLEIGDVIDYGLKTEEVDMYNCTDPETIILNDDFPILKGLKRYYVEKNLFINFKSLNGAPELKKNSTIKKFQFVVYDLTYENLPPYKEEIWAPPLLTEQTIKIEVCNIRGKNVRTSTRFLGEKGELKTQVTEEDLKKSIKNRVGMPYSSQQYSYFLKWYDKNYTERGLELSPAEQLKLYFYFQKYYVLTYHFGANAYIKAYHLRNVSEPYFIRNMTYFAEKNNIEYDLVFSSSKYNSSLDDIIFKGDLQQILRFKDDNDEWVYVQNPTAYQTLSYVNSSLGGQKAIGYFRPKNRFREIDIPESTDSDNVQTVEIQITPDLDTKGARLQTRNSMLGIFKYTNSAKILYNTDYYLDLAKAILPEGEEEAMLEGKKYKKGIEKTEENIRSNPEEKLNWMKDYRREDFDIDTYESFTLVSSGVMADEDSLVYTDVFTMKDIVSKAGPNYVVDLSDIAVGQVSFTEKEQTERINDIYINYPKTYIYRYTIDIPEGYAAFGLETFNEQVENLYGKLHLSAKTEGNQVVIFMEKRYKDSHVDKEKWPEFMEFIVPAMKMNEAKIVLKKV